MEVLRAEADSVRQFPKRRRLFRPFDHPAGPDDRPESAGRQYDRLRAAFPARAEARELRLLVSREESDVLAIREA